MLAAVGVPRPDKRELPHMRATEEGLHPRTVGEVAPPIEGVRVGQVVQVLLPHGRAMGIAHVREEGMRLLPRDGFAAMIGKISGCQRDTLHPGSATPVPATRQGWRFGDWLEQKNGHERPLHPGPGWLVCGWTWLNQAGSGWTWVAWLDDDDDEDNADNNTEDRRRRQQCNAPNDLLVGASLALGPGGLAEDQARLARLAARQ